jgi:hypothetical protein
MKLQSSLLFAVALIAPTVAMGDANTSATENLPLTVHMQWAIGDLGTTIDLRYEVNTVSDGTLEAAEYTSAGYLLVQGSVNIGERELGQIIAAEGNANVASLPTELAPAVATSASNKSVPDVLICYSWLNLTVRQHGLTKSVKRDCQEDEGSLAVAAFARDLIRTAQVHFPDIGKSQLWQHELGQSAE